MVTGGTGLIGGYVVGEFMKQGRTVVCVTRAKADKVSVRDRVLTNLKHLGVWLEEFEARLLVIQGDCAEPFLGLNEEDKEYR
jgi:thioester reductase-like protein